MENHEFERINEIEEEIGDYYQKIVGGSDWEFFISYLANVIHKDEIHKNDHFVIECNFFNNKKLTRKQIAEKNLALAEWGLCASASDYDVFKLDYDRRVKQIKDYYKKVYKITKNKKYFKCINRVECFIDLIREFYSPTGNFDDDEVDEEFEGNLEQVVGETKIPEQTKDEREYYGMIQEFNKLNPTDEHYQKKKKHLISAIKWYGIEVGKSEKDVMDVINSLVKEVEVLPTKEIGGAGPGNYKKE